MVNGTDKYGQKLMVEEPSEAQQPQFEHRSRSLVRLKVPQAYEDNSHCACGRSSGTVWPSSYRIASQSLS